jgi:hypothetical protein
VTRCGDWLYVFDLACYVLVAYNTSNTAEASRYPKLL